MGKLKLLVATLVLCGIAQPADAQVGSDAAIDATTALSPAGPSTFNTLPSTDIVSEFEFNLGLTMGYSRRSIVLERADQSLDAIANRIDMDLSLSLGLPYRLQLSSVIPTLLIQQGVGAAPLRVPTAAPSRIVVTNLRDIRMLLSYQALQRATSAIGLTIQAELVLPTGSPGVYGGTGAWGAALGVNVDYALDDWRFGGHLAGRYAPVATIGTAKVGSELRVAGGVARYFLSEVIRLSIEFDSRWRLDSQPAIAEFSQHIFEYGLGIRYRPSEPGDYAITGQVTTGIGGAGAPEFRCLIGIRYGSSGPP